MGLGVVFISGILFLLLSITGAREQIINSISPNLKNGIAVGIGLFIAFIIILLFMDVFDTIGTLVGVAEQGGFIKDNKLPRARQAMLSDAVGTMMIRNVVKI